MRKQRLLSKLKPTKKKLWLLLPLLLLAAGIYLLITTLAPAVPPQSQPEGIYTQDEAVEIQDNRLYIPKISVDVPFNTGSYAVLEKGAWHRRPENGDPEKGGNFVLSAHRFEMGWTPQQTRARSPFYHIDRLEPGDKIFVDYNKKRYAYEVTKKYKVDRYAVHIEGPSEEPKMTLYSCDRRGEPYGREVIEAKPLSP